ncbi:hypothetical protein ACN24M_16340 [Streptomyces microflavus]|uniref:hypothetical protein n=1 Tax=Streptomyces microflavus TaxID=1919 RepID=UPI003B21E14B
MSPTADSIPRDVTRNTSHNVAFAVGDHIANDGLLGTGKHKAGITATTLNPAENVGTAVTVGFTKNAFELIRSYYIRKDSTTDQITPVVKRALALREGMAPTPDLPAGEPADHPANVLTVLGDRETMRSTEVLAALIRMWPNEYSEWTFADLKAALVGIGAEPRKLGGIMTVRRSRVLEGIEDRDDNTPESNAS